MTPPCTFLGGCTATFTETVWTRRGGRMRVCRDHRKILVDAGEVIDGPPPTIEIRLDPNEAHRKAIKTGIAAAKAKGVHTGRPPTCLPQGAVDAVLAGGSPAEIARTYRVSKATLSRRVASTRIKGAEGAEGAKPAPTSTPKEAMADTHTPDSKDNKIAANMVEASRLLTEANRIQSRGEAEIRAGQAKIEEARALARQARDLLGDL